MTTASNAPPVVDGAGQVVSDSAAATSHRRSFRRTNILSTLTSEERRAFLQERLDQACMFRQICASKHGVPGPTERNVLGEPPTIVEYQEVATQTGITVEEARRREELARREAMVEIREEVARRQAEAAAAGSQSVTDVPESSVQLREELARREMEIAGLKQEREDATQRQQTVQAREDAIRAEQAAQRQEQEMDSEDTPYTLPMAEQIAPKKSWLRRNWLALTGLGSGLGTLATVLVLGLSGGGNPQIPVNPPVVIDNDADTLDTLERNGLSAPQTPLGQQILDAFERDPSLRRDVMQRVEDVLLRQPADSRASVEGGTEGDE